jgi:hypothetical protein
VIGSGLLCCHFPTTDLQRQTQPLDFRRLTPQQVPGLANCNQQGYYALGERVHSVLKELKRPRAGLFFFFCLCACSKSYRMLGCVVVTTMSGQWWIGVSETLGTRQLSSAVPPTKPPGSLFTGGLIVYGTTIDKADPSPRRGSWGPARNRYEPFRSA